MSRRLFWDAFARSRWIQAVALALAVAIFVVQCGHDGGAARALSKLNYDSLPSKAPRPRQPVDTLHAAATELKTLMAEQARRHLSKAQADKAGSARKRIATELRSLDGKFSADRVKLEKLGADAALTRLGRVESKTTKLERQLRTALARVPASGARAPRAADATKVLTALSPDRPEQPLSSDLGFGADNAKPAPATLSAGITPAYGAPNATEQASDLARSPEQQDLVETPETKVTPAIHSLAQQLHRDPVQIYTYVHNNIRYQPYFGIRKGAGQTLAEGSGSDADQAALLIALLRDSGVHARFVQGVAQMPAAKVANWLGVNTQAGQRIDAAPDILASAGIPTTGIRANGELVKVRFDHIWAEAYVPNDAYRGTEEALGGKTWLPLDPSIKETLFNAPTADFKSVLRPSAQRLADGLVANSSSSGDAVVLPNADQLQATNDSVAADVQSRLAEHGITKDSSVADLVGSTEVRPVQATYLPSSLPAQARSVTAELRAIPASLQSRVSFSVSGSDPLSLPSSDTEDATGGGLSFSAPTTDLANKRITLAYVPATQGDAEIIDAYHGLLNAPAYAAALIPVLRVDGQVVARGHTAVSTGYTQNFQITYNSPGYAPDVVTNPVYVGSLSAVGLDLGTISRSQLRARTQALRELVPTVTPANIVTDARGGEMLSELTALYFLRTDSFNDILGRALDTHQSRAVSGAITATSVTPRYISSFPVSVKFDGLTIDVDQDSQVVVAKSGGPDISSYMRLSGANASASEAAIFKYSLGWDAVSAVDVMRAAAEQHVAVHRVTSENVSSELDRLQLPASTEREIAKAVSTPGTEVLTPEREITIGSWTGAGYVISNSTGADYRISGGISGGCAPSLPSYDPFGPFSDSLGHFCPQVDDEISCDVAKMVVFAIAVLVFAALMFFLTYLAIGFFAAAAALPATASLIAFVELAAGGLHALFAAGLVAFPFLVSLDILVDEAKKC